MIDPVNIPTHLYRMARLCSINYFVYSSSKANGDQSLLELELQIRYNHPKILVTYHNKSLYYFTFGSASQHQPTPKNEDSVVVDKVPEIELEFDIAKEYPILQLKNHGVIKVDENTTTQDEQIPFASFSFLKAFKKMIQYNLSLSRALHIFGNQALIERDGKYHLLFLEPSLHPSGDILLSVTTRPCVELYDTSNPDIKDEVVVYLAPSGIRCHLFDPSSLQKNLITKKNGSNESLLNLIKLSTGIDYSLNEELVWVRLIPNLKHLNNQTSTIAKFIHTVDNKKFILWPWRLCFLQRGENMEVQEKPSALEKPSSNPLSLLSRFLDFQVTKKEEQKVQTDQVLETQNSFQPGSHPMSMSTGSIMETPVDMEVDDLFGEEMNEEAAAAAADAAASAANDDLFGEESEEEKEKKDEAFYETFYESQAAEPEKPSIPAPPLFSPKLKPYLDIPKDQMMMRKWTTPGYDDPGAPAPIIPTPHYVHPSQTPANGHNSPSSVFSPILFNPIIKSDIDTKYGKGGKFYVDRESSADPDLEKIKSVRATSVSTFFPTKKDSRGFDRDDESSSEESDVDESPLVPQDIEKEQPIMIESKLMNEQHPSQDTTMDHTRLPKSEHSNNNTNQSTPSSQHIKGAFFNTTTFGPFSPLDLDATQQNWPTTPSSKEQDIVGPSDSSESTNYLPLILRSINVGSIPPKFFLNGQQKSTLYEKEQFEDMVVLENEVDEVLKFLTPSLVYSKENFMDKKNEVDHVSVPIFPELTTVFPRCHRVNLIDLLIDHKGQEADDAQINFLDDITVDDEMLNPHAQYKKLREFEWDENTNEEEYARHIALKKKYVSSRTIGEDQLFPLPHSKVTVLKNSSIVNLDSSAIRFWRLLNFSPPTQRNTQCILVTDELLTQNPHDLLDQVFQNYRECNFGEMARLQLGDVNGVCMGRHVAERLESIAGLIKQDLIGKGNQFDFGSPLLLLFADSGKMSPLERAKVAQRFSNALKNEQLPLVNVFTASIDSQNLKYLAGHKLSKISKIIYNLWPSASKPFASLARDPPERIGFKFLKDVAAADDAFLHIAYERSIDKHWSTAAWSDPLGLVVHTKSWYNETKDLSAICDDIWRISADLFRHLAEERAFSGKKFLVLSRVNNILLDDELVHWKRLSLKHRDISMIVLTVNDTPSRLFGDIDQKKIPKVEEKQESVISNPSPSLMTSPASFTFHSPQQFANVPSFLSPGDVSGTPTMTSVLPPQSEECLVRDPNANLIGVVPKSPLSLLHYSSRVGTKTGYLLKEDSETAGYLVLEVNMLSCSSYWDLDVLMKIVLNHYKKLAVLGNVIGVHDSLGLVPWHILAVRKCMHYLVHVLVEKKEAPHR